MSFAELDRMRSAVVEEAEIVGSTLGFSGSNLFNKLSCTFDIVVIDEAAQAVETTTLIPLMRGCKQVQEPGGLVLCFNQEINRCRFSVELL